MEIFSMSLWDGYLRDTYLIYATSTHFNMYFISIFKWAAMPWQGLMGLRIVGPSQTAKQDAFILYATYFILYVRALAIESSHKSPIHLTNIPQCIILINRHTCINFAADHNFLDPSICRAACRCSIFKRLSYWRDSTVTSKYFEANYAVNTSS